MPSFSHLRRSLFATAGGLGLIGLGAVTGCSPLRTITEATAWVLRESLRLGADSRRLHVMATAPAPTTRRCWHSTHAGCSA